MSNRLRFWRRAALALYLAAIPATLLSAWAYGLTLADTQTLHAAQSRLSATIEAENNRIRGRR